MEVVWFTGGRVLSFEFQVLSSAGYIYNGDSNHVATKYWILNPTTEHSHWQTLCSPNLFIYLCVQVSVRDVLGFTSHSHGCRSRGWPITFGSYLYRPHTGVWLIYKGIANGTRTQLHNQTSQFPEVGGLITALKLIPTPPIRVLHHFLD